MTTNHSSTANSSTSANQSGQVNGHQKSILVPIDFSPESVAALRDATCIAAQTHANLILLNVVEGKTFYRGNYSPGAQSKVLQSHARQMEQLAETELPASVAVNMIVVEGDPAIEIKRIAKERNVDRIIVGMHQHRRHWFGKSTAKEVHQSAPSKVVVLRSLSTALAIPA